MFGVLLKRKYGHCRHIQRSDPCKDTRRWSPVSQMDILPRSPLEKPAILMTGWWASILQSCETTLCWSHEICSIFSNNLRELTQGFHHKITIKYFMHYFCCLLCNFITFKIHLGVYDVCQESMMSGVCDVRLCSPPVAPQFHLISFILVCIRKLLRQ